MIDEQPNSLDLTFRIARDARVEGQVPRHQEPGDSTEISSALPDD